MKKNQKIAGRSVVAAALAAGLVVACSPKQSGMSYETVAVERDTISNSVTSMMVAMELPREVMEAP